MGVEGTEKSFISAPHKKMTPTHLLLTRATNSNSDGTINTHQQHLYVCVIHCLKNDVYFFLFLVIISALTKSSTWVQSIGADQESKKGKSFGFQNHLECFHDTFMTLLVGLLLRHSLIIYSILGLSALMFIVPLWAKFIVDVWHSAESDT